MQYSVDEIAKILEVKNYAPGFSEIQITLAEIDSRSVFQPEVTMFFALPGNQSDGHDYIPSLINKGVKVFVISNTSEHYDDEVCLLKVDDVLKALQKLAAYHRSQFNIPVIGITGSNGKTIVKEWLTSILQNQFNVCKSPKSYNSQIGVALSVLELNDQHQIAVFEAGISQINEMDILLQMIQPTIGLLTNIGDAHQAGFNGMDEKIREKLVLFKDVNKCIYCEDYEGVAYQRRNYLNNVSWSRKKPASYQIKVEHKTEDGLKIRVLHDSQEFNFNIKFYDDASFENIIHCIICALELGMEVIHIQQALDQLSNLPMRFEKKEGIQGCVLINDSYSLDFKSLQLALQWADQQVHQLSRTLILTDFADQKENPDFWLRVATLLNQYSIHTLVGVGKNIQSIQKFLNDTINFIHFDNTAALINQLNQLNFVDQLIIIKGARSFQLEKVFHHLSLSKHDTILEIDLNAINHNLQVYKSLLNKNTRIMAIVKAAAYGSGHYEVAALLENKKIDYLAVAYPDEGILLRQKNVKSPVMVMNTGSADFNLLLDYQLEPEIFSLDQFKRMMREIGKHTFIAIHLKLDTGMHRLGFLEEDLDELIRLLKLYTNIEIKSIFSHLSGSDSSDFDSFTKSQAELFENMSFKIMKDLPKRPLLHLLNSGGITRHPQLQYDMIRLGIGLYGIDPAADISGRLEKVHTLKTRVSQIKWFEPGESISYNRSVFLKNRTKIAVLALGYADGLPRSVSMKAYTFWCNKYRIPLVGLVCMDMCMADVTIIESIEEGSEIEIFGKNAPIERLAEAVGTIPYEILCGISSRVKRVFLQD